MNMTQEEPSSFASSVKETPAVKAMGTNGASGVQATSDTNVAVQATSDSAPGVFGTSTSGHGVVGITESHNTGGFGVQGISNNGHGVHGFSRNFIGVSGESETSVGVAGKGGSIGVEGVTSSGIGVFGTSTSGLAGQFDGNVQVKGNLLVSSSMKETPAVKAEGISGADGVDATSDTGTGVFGTSTFGTGVLGVTQSETTDGFGVEGISTFGLGVYGHCASGTGVYGETNGGIGVKGLSSLNGTGVQGFGKLGIGVSGSSETSIGVFGTSKSGLAGQFEGNVQVKGNLSVTGTKAFVQVHPSDPSREIVYVALEGGEAGTYVRGSGQLQSGKAVLALPEHFGLVAENSGLTVQLTPRGQWLQLYVVELDTAQLVVREAQGKSGVFDYLIQGVRKGSEPHEVIRTKR
jgi:hypothetical protein